MASHEGWAWQSSKLKFQTNSYSRFILACTRNEILDYNNRLARFGAEVADRKKPSPFTFEVWDFMQEAKKACKSEALDGIDYSKIPLALEEDFEYRDDYKFNADEHDMDE